MSNKVEVPYFGKLDLSPTVYSDNEENNTFLLRRLKRLGLYAPTLLFTGIHSVEMNTVKVYGVDTSTRRTTFALTEYELSEDAVWGSLWDYSYDGDPSIILVYDRIKMNPSEERSTWEFNPGVSPKDALIAALEVKWKI